MITQIEIGGYRLLDGFEADFEPLTVVIGANAVGKSTLIDCLQLIADCCEHPLNTAISWHHGAASLLTAGNGNRELTWKVTFNKPAMWDDFPLEQEEPLVYEAVLQANALIQQMHPRFEVLRTQEPVHGEPLKFLEATPYQQHIFNTEQLRLVPFDEAQSSPDVVRDADSVAVPPGSGRAGAQQEAALLLSQIRFFNEFPVPSWVRLLLTHMAFYPGFDVTHSSELRTKAADIKPDTTLSSNGDNLGTVLHEILTRYDFRPAAEELRDFLRVAYPTFEEIHCDTTHGTPPQVLVRVRERGMSRSMEMWELSDGMLRFLCLATALLNPQPQPLVAIDEPELGLHPGLLPIVAEIIKTAAERTQVLVTTHSPDLLNCFDIADVAVMARDADDAKVTWHRPANRKTLVEMLDNITGETLGDLHRSGELEAGV
jgi:predicted ATPase